MKPLRIDLLKGFSLYKVLYFPNPNNEGRASKNDYPVNKLQAASCDIEHLLKSRYLNKENLDDKDNGRNENEPFGVLPGQAFEG